MQITPFLYPAAADAPKARITWDNLEAVLVLGNKYDMKGLVQKGSAFLKARKEKLDKQHDSSKFVWKWLKLTAQLGLDDLVLCCIGAVKRLYKHMRLQEQQIAGLPYEALKQLLLQGCVLC